MEFDPFEIPEAKHEVKKKRRKQGRQLLIWEILEMQDRRVSEDLAKDKEEFDLINANRMLTDIIEPSSDLILPLMRHQKEWLAWAFKQEKFAAKGGILADEMGMGKTVQAIALVLLKRMTSQGICGNELPSTSASRPVELPAIRGTLVICPLGAVEHWVNEIESCIAKGSTKVLVYHGAHRAKSIHQVLEYDFVITTYSIVRSEYWKHVKYCQWCRKLLDKCECERGRKKKAMEAATNDSPIDDNLAAEQGAVMLKRKSILYSVTWERIILDEAHYIKKRQSKTSQAVFALHSLYKWALTGTPFQNYVAELYSLICFLRIFPYSYHFCRKCDCRKLEPSTYSCRHCNHRRTHFSWWKKNVTKPIRNYGNSGRGKGALIFLKHRILGSIMQRRTKMSRAADLALPPKIVVLRRDSLDAVEEDYYMELHKKTLADFNEYADAGALLNNYTRIPHLLMPMRQAVNHAYLVEYSISSMKQKGETADTNNIKMCELCDFPVEVPMVTSCAHIFCKPCWNGYAAGMERIRCPTCSKLLNVAFTMNTDCREQKSDTIKGCSLSSSILDRIDLDNF